MWSIEAEEDLGEQCQAGGRASVKSSRKWDIGVFEAYQDGWYG